MSPHPHLETSLTPPPPTRAEGNSAPLRHVHLFLLPVRLPHAECTGRHRHPGARASAGHPPSQPGGSRSAARRQVTSRGEADSALQMPPWERDVHGPPRQLRAARAGWPAAWQRRGLPSAPRSSQAPPPARRPSPHLRRLGPGAPVSEALLPARPPSAGRATSGMHCPLIVNPIMVIK